MLMSHTACNVVWRISPSNELELLVHNYRSTDPETRKKSGWQVRFPTGTSRSGEFGESTEETSARKLKEETGLLAIDTEEIARKRSSHPKHVFLIAFSECLGELHSGPIEIGGDEMSAPYWVSARGLGQQIAPAQLWAYTAAMKRLSVMVAAQ